MSGNEQGDRRRSPRVEAVLKVEYQSPQDLLSDYITNLGQGGVFIHTSMQFALGQRISFALSFPGLLEPMLFHGIVRWTRAPGESDEEPAGAGVEVDLSDARERDQWGELITQLAGAQATTAAASPDPSGFRVLLVEDNAFALELFEYALLKLRSARGEGELFEVLAAPDAEQALGKLSEPIQLAIVDHFLPGMNGCELVTRMRQQPATCETPVIVVSVGGEEVRRQAYESGADLFLDKPVLNRQLVETITALLAQRG